MLKIRIPKSIHNIRKYVTAVHLQRSLRATANNKLWRAVLAGELSSRNCITRRERVPVVVVSTSDAAPDRARPDRNRRADVYASSPSPSSLDFLCPVTVRDAGGNCGYSHVVADGWPEIGPGSARIPKRNETLIRLGPFDGTTIGDGRRLSVEFASPVRRSSRRGRTVYTNDRSTVRN